MERNEHVTGLGNSNEGISASGPITCVTFCLFVKRLFNAFDFVFKRSYIPDLSSR